jgi:Mg2+-importing ATPase
VTIAGDRVDEEEVERPRQWDVHAVRNFMITFGLLSSGFDLVAFAVLLQVFHADATAFRTGWFIESALTELAVLFVLRTRRVVFRSLPARALLVTSIVVALVAIALPFVPDLAGPLGLAPPRWQVIVALIAITCTYVVAAEVTKRLLYRAARAGAFRPGRVVVPGPERAVRRVAHEHGHRHPPAAGRPRLRARSR